MEKIEDFQRERRRLHDKLLEFASRDMKGFLHLDYKAYQSGALPAKVKEMLGLVASLVLRCEDCISYHLIRCKEEKVTSEEFKEAMMVALTVGGSITIPHLRRAVDAWYEIKEDEDG